MDLSIIIPVYNTPKESLLRCFTSICFPESLKYEVIIVDDGSCNEIAQFCRDYAGTHADFCCFHQENRGVSVARNKGMEIATGRYILFVDADDLLIPATIQMNHLVGEWDVIFYDYEVQEGKRIWVYRVFEGIDITGLSKKDYLRIACQDRVNVCYARLFGRDFLLRNRIRFNEDMVMAEDAAFVLSTIACADSIAYIPKRVYRYIHTCESGERRLVLFPREAVSNSIKLYEIRMTVLAHLDKTLDLTSAEREYMQAEAIDRLVRILFEAKGTLLLKGMDFGQSEKEVCLLMQEVYQNSGKTFFWLTRLKCYLLRTDWRIAIWLYAGLRKMRILLRK